MGFPPQITAFVQQSGPLIGTMILMYLMFNIMLVRPRKKEQKRVAEMQAKLKRGDKIVTIGGVYGVVTDLSEGTIMLKIAEKVDIEIARSAIDKFQNPKKNVVEK